jgi:glycosyltransferase involved in cell wall biosynthesis
VALAMADHKTWRFLCIGGAQDHHEVAVQLEIPPQRMASTAWREIDLHHMVVSQLDVGIVPLHESTFNAAKSWLKGLEYAALGIPFVASELPEYERLAHVHGIGTVVPPRARNWRRALNRLMSDPDQTAMLGTQYRARVVQDLTIETNAWRWAEAWQTALVNRRKRAIQPTRR